MTLPTYVAGLPAELAVFVLAMTPLVEMQAAIPAGILVYGMPAWEAYLIALLGNIVPTFLVYGLGQWWIEWTERRKGWLHRITDVVLRRAHDKLHAKVSKAGLVALTVFVALPFPGAGVWTGSVGAFLIGIPFRTALPYIIAGNVINGLLVTLATTGTVAFFRFFL